jgi:branched-chain amino acid transport system ATP-binding protein
VTAPLLEARHVTARIGGAEILHSVSLSVAEGQAVCLLGPNGAGKTTVLRAISGLVPARSGEMLFRGKGMGSARPWHRVGLGIAHVPQDRRCFATLTVFENLQMGAYLSPASANERRDRVWAMFPALYEKRDARAGDLSGGQQQMLAIARALMGSPRLLLLDEPTLGLAPNLVVSLRDTLARLAGDHGLGMLLVEQNVDLALRVCDRVYVLCAGHIVIADRAASDVSEAELADAYLGVTP